MSEPSQLLQAQAFVERFFPEKVAAFNSYVVKAGGRIHQDDDLFVLLELLGWQALILEETLERMTAIGQSVHESTDPVEISRSVADKVEKYITEVFSTRLDRLETKFETLSNILGGEGVADSAKRLEEAAAALQTFAEHQHRKTNDGISDFAAVASRTNDLVTRAGSIEHRIARIVTKRVIWGVVVAVGAFLVIHFLVPGWH